MFTSFTTRVQQAAQRVNRIVSPPLVRYESWINQAPVQLHILSFVRLAIFALLVAMANVGYPILIVLVLLIGLLFSKQV
jgi:hypothetical protein